METEYEETRISEDEILLQRCRCAETLEEQERCFEDLAVFLETVGTRKCNDAIDIDDDGENYDDDDGGDNDVVGGDDGGQCVHRHEGQVRSSGTAHCSTAT